MKDFSFSNYLCEFGFTYYEFSSNLDRLRLNFPLIIAQIEKHIIVKILIFLQIMVENEEKIGEKKETESFLSFFVSIDFLIN